MSESKAIMDIEWEILINNCVIWIVYLIKEVSTLERRLSKSKKL